MQPMKMLVSLFIVLVLTVQLHTHAAQALRARARIIRKGEKGKKSLTFTRKIHSTVSPINQRVNAAINQRPNAAINQNVNHAINQRHNPAINQRANPAIHGESHHVDKSIVPHVIEQKEKVVIYPPVFKDDSLSRNRQPVAPPLVPGRSDRDTGKGRAVNNDVDSEPGVEDGLSNRVQVTPLALWARSNIKDGYVQTTPLSPRRPKNYKYKLRNETHVIQAHKHFVSPVPKMHVNHHIKVNPGGRNPALDFVQNKRGRPTAKLSASGINAEFNELKHRRQGNHPASDGKNGQSNIEWDNDMFFIKWGSSGLSDQIKVRRAPHTATGTPWPLPERFARDTEKIFRVDASSFQLTIVNQTCDILEDAVSRYETLIVEDAVEDTYDNLQHVESTFLNDPALKYQSPLFKEAPVISQVEIDIKKPCSRYPSFKMDESYVLKLTDGERRITANEVWGALRGLETLSQLIWRGRDSKLYTTESISIDKPRFPHRGILIDTARHYIFKEVIFDVLRAMEYNKMNVLHWHMTDDQSFPFQSRKFPEMSEKGAFHPSYVYTHDDVADIVEFARLRGIRVIPEFDVPGHTYAWGHGRPDVIARCYSKENPVEGMTGPIDPSKESTYVFLKELMGEVLSLFPDTYLHAGGDEVPDQCWGANPDLMKAGETLINKNDGLIKNLERKIRYTVGQKRHPSISTKQLWDYFENRFMKDSMEAGREQDRDVEFVIWQEAAVKANLNYVNRTIAQIWFGDAPLIREAIGMGYKGILYSSCWYLDMIKFGPDWPKYYTCDPAFPGQGVDERKVFGGEACLWGEYVDNENLMSRLWPRASAAAERLWSARDVKDVDAAAPRLQEQRCRMLSRGLSVDQISGPDYCFRKGKVGGHTWSAQRAFSIRDRFASKLTNDSVVVVLQVAVILAVLTVVMRASFTQRMFSSVRSTRRSAILTSFVSLIALAFLAYSALWMWSVS